MTCPEAADIQQPGLGLEVLTCDPVLQLVYQAGLLPLKDLRSVMLCLDTEEVTCITEGQARSAISKWGDTLRQLVVGSEVFTQRVRALVWDLETRMVQLEVPLWAVHPTLDTPLVLGQLAPMAMYDELAAVGQVGCSLWVKLVQPVTAVQSTPRIFDELAALGQALRSMTHPAAWGQVYANLWDTVAASTSLCMKPVLVLMLSSVIAVESRLSYVTLRHAAYADKGVVNLGQMVAKILCKMMAYEYGPKDLHRVTKHLRQVGPTLSPFTLFIMRACRTCPEQRLDQRAAEKRQLRARLEEFLAAEGDKVLYCRKAWTSFLLGLELRHLVAFYIKFLYDGFQ